VVLAEWQSRAQPVFVGRLTARMRSREPGRVAPIRPRTRNVRISDTRVRCTPRGSTRWAWRRRTASWHRPARRMAWRPRPGCSIYGRETIMSLLGNRIVLQNKKSRTVDPGRLGHPRSTAPCCCHWHEVSIGTRLPANIIAGGIHRVKAAQTRRISRITASRPCCTSASSSGTAFPDGNELGSYTKNRHSLRDPQIIGRRGPKPCSSFSPTRMNATIADSIIDREKAGLLRHHPAAELHEHHRDDQDSGGG